MCRLQRRLTRLDMSAHSQISPLRKMQQMPVALPPASSLFVPVNVSATPATLPPTL